jgi:hypothetical protein
MAGHRADHLARHVLNEMAGSVAGHDGPGGKGQQLSSLVLRSGGHFFGARTARLPWESCECGDRACHWKIE